MFISSGCNLFNIFLANLITGTIKQNNSPCIKCNTSLYNEVPFKLQSVFLVLKRILNIQLMNIMDEYKTERNLEAGDSVLMLFPIIY